MLDVKSNATNGANPSVVSAFDYSVNNLGQRDDVSRTGSAFTSANTEAWNYNAKGEVVTANSSNNAFDRSYEFDGIGNRKKSADSITLPTADNYSANTLNQLTTVNGGVRIHDADGNLTDDGTKLFVWDAENRLIEIKLKSDNSTVATYAYDFDSRRITKTVGSIVTNFVYEDWNPIAEFTGTTLSKSYTWGMDLSGSMQGAGGVGGLLSVNDGNDTYYPTFDGNGNVSEYVDATGAVVAHYEYDAFGQVVASGTKANDFSHQFSSKQLDSESGLHYYGYRYYDSSNGRWLSRDPIEESGGLNIYGFVLNSPKNHWDLIGLNVCGMAFNSNGTGINNGGSGRSFSEDMISLRENLSTLSGLLRSAYEQAAQVYEMARRADLPTAGAVGTAADYLPLLGDAGLFAALKMSENNLLKCLAKNGHDCKCCEKEQEAYEKAKKVYMEAINN